MGEQRPAHAAICADLEQWIRRAEPPCGAGRAMAHSGDGSRFRWLADSPAGLANAADFIF